VLKIEAELIHAGCSTIRSEIHNLINNVWIKEELAEEWKELIIVPIYKKGDKNCGNYKGITLLLITYKLFSNILPFKLTPYAEEIVVGPSKWISTQKINC
jgi:hypothetical protein